MSDVSQYRRLGDCAIGSDAAFCLPDEPNSLPYGLARLVEPSRFGHLPDNAGMTAPMHPFDEAMRLDRKLLPVNRALFCEPNPQPIKAALAAKGRMNDSVRLPLVAASEGCKARLREVIASYEAP